MTEAIEIDRVPEMAAQAPLKLFPVLDADNPAVAPPSWDAVVAPAAVVRKTKFLFSARMRTVSKLNKKKSRVRAARRLKSKPQGVKRSPPLYPVKNKKIVAKRARTKIIVQKPKRSAVILRFPARPHRSGTVRHQRVA